MTRLNNATPEKALMTMQIAAWRGFAALTAGLKKHALALSCVLLAWLPSEACMALDEQARVDSLFQPWSRSDAPGCAVAVTKDGQTLLERGYGMADLEQGVAIRPQTVFNIASTSKQFTTTAILLLAQDGRLSLDDDVRKYVPELRDFGAVITIRQLAHHTGGLRDYLTMLVLAGWNWVDDLPVERMLDITNRRKTLVSAPGSKFVYSNTGYVLMAMIVERVSGQSFGSFTRERIFTPLGMHHTRFYDDRRMIVPQRALGYVKLPGGGFGAWRPSYTIVGDGGLLTTLQDLASWERNFSAPRLGSNPGQLVEELLQPGRLTDGSSTEYGLGVDLGEYRGLQTFHHGGGVLGYSSFMLHVPAERFGAHILCNAGNLPVEELSHALADIYLEGRFKSGQPTPVPVREQEAKAPAVADEGPAGRVTPLGDYAGTYYSEELGTQYVVRATTDGLSITVGYLPIARWVRAGPDRFKYTDLDLNVVFRRNERGGITGFAIESPRIQGLSFKRTGGRT
jgi:CubicO group peptidase (beta-lactamase class C family)